MGTQAGNGNREIQTAVVIVPFALETPNPMLLALLQIKFCSKRTTLTVEDHSAKEEHPKYIPKSITEQYLHRRNVKSC